MHGRLFILLAALAMPLAGAGDAALDRATLRGVTAVNVVIDAIPAELQKEGATPATLQARLEEKLRNGGLKIDPAASEFAGFRLTSVRAGRGPFAISATLGLYQPVILVRDRNVKTATQTWEVDTVALADSKQVYRACMDSVDELADRFLAAYRSVNAASGGGNNLPVPPAR